MSRSFHILSAVCSAFAGSPLLAARSAAVVPDVTLEVFGDSIPVLPRSGQLQLKSVECREVITYWSGPLLRPTFKGDTSGLVVD